MPNHTFIDAIRRELDRRISAGDSQAQIGAKAKIHPAQLSYFRHGRRGLGAEALAKLATAMGGAILVQFSETTETKKTGK